MLTKFSQLTIHVYARLKKKTLKFDVNNPLLIPWIKVFLYRTCGNDFIYHFAAPHSWIYRNEAERTQCRNKLDIS